MSYTEHPIYDALVAEQERTEPPARSHWRETVTAAVLLVAVAVVCALMIVAAAKWGQS